MHSKVRVEMHLEPLHKGKKSCLAKEVVVPGVVAIGVGT